MKNTRGFFHLVLCSFVLLTIWTLNPLQSRAQTTRNVVDQVTKHGDNLYSITVPAIIARPELASMSFPILGSDNLPIPSNFRNDIAGSLENAITKRLGVRYRRKGTDDRGYDCSGFIWRVFRESGTNFKRVAARTLWRQLPKATEEERTQFGTLVFFNGLKHVGVVRDASSFYHASLSRGVTLSTFSGYWRRRLTGYRRAPGASRLEQPLFVSNR
jgi:cell wall-associated NlpC family hydrolase